MSPVRTRFAPSPTGHLHIGNAWAGFFNWLLARSQGGVFVLRIEDTDRSRSTEQYEEAIFEDLRWLGLTWDEGPDIGGPHGPYRQTERGALYRQYAQALLAAGAAYHCYCTPEELDAERAAAEAARRPYRYSGRCRRLSDARRARFVAEGRQPTIRLRIRDFGQTIAVDDLIQGRVVFEPEHLDDYIIVRSDGSPLYNFANVVDDHLMEITHVIRGVEHLNNTPRQWVMYHALGWTPPQVAHLPVILGPDRKKLSKRHGATAVRDYRRDGYLPEALLNFFALMAWHPDDEREVYTVDDLVAKFRLQDVGQASPIFDPAKLLWLNGVHVRQLLACDPGRVVDLCLPSLVAAGLAPQDPPPAFRAYVSRVVAVLGERVRVGRDILTYGDFFFTDDIRYERQGVDRYFRDAGVGPLLRELRARVAAADSFDAQAAERLVRDLAARAGVDPRAIIHPARLALTGKTAGPGLFDLMALLGRDRVAARLDRAVEWIARHPAGG